MRWSLRAAITVAARALSWSEPPPTHCSAFESAKSKCWSGRAGGSSKYGLLGTLVVPPATDRRACAAQLLELDALGLEERIARLHP